MMKKSVVYSIVAGLTLAFSSSADAQDSVGVTLYKYDDNFIQLMRSELEANARQHQLTLLMNDSQNSQFVQNNQVQTLIERRVKALAVNLVDPVAWVTVIGKAKEANVPIVLFNKDPGQKAINSYAKAYYIGTDSDAEGRAQAKMIAKHWKADTALDLNRDGKMQYALLKGELGHPAAEKRTKAVIEELAAQGVQTEQVVLESAEWNKEVATKKVAAWLSATPQTIEVIISNNDSMALGALEASAVQGQKLPVYGVDATPEAVNLVKIGALAGTVKNDWQTQSKAIIDFTKALSEGKDPEKSTQWKTENRVLRVPSLAVDKDNVSDL